MTTRLNAERRGAGRGNRGDVGRSRQWSALAEDNRQVAIALARAGAIDAEDLIHMLHPPGAELLLSRLRQRQKAQAKQAQTEKAEQFTRDILQLPNRGQGAKKRRG